MKIRSWENLYLDWLSECPDLLVVHFEQLAGREEEEGGIRKEELRRVAEFLGFGGGDLEERLECVASHPEGSFHRLAGAGGGGGGGGGGPYSAEQKRRLRRAVDRVDGALKRRRKEPIPREMYRMAHQEVP